MEKKPRDSRRLYNTFRTILIKSDAYHQLGRLQSRGAAAKRPPAVTCCSWMGHTIAIPKDRCPRNWVNSRTRTNGHCTRRISASAYRQAHRGRLRLLGVQEGCLPFRRAGFDRFFSSSSGGFLVSSSSSFLVSSASFFGFEWLSTLFARVFSQVEQTIGYRPDGGNQHGEHRYPVL